MKLEVVEVPRQRTIATKKSRCTRIKKRYIMWFLSRRVHKGDVGILELGHGFYSWSWSFVGTRGGGRCTFWNSTLSCKMARSTTSKASQGLTTGSGLVRFRRRLVVLEDVLALARETRTTLAFSFLSFPMNWASTRWWNSRAQVASWWVTECYHRKKSTRKTKVWEAFASIHIGSIRFIVGIHREGGFTRITTITTILLVVAGIIVEVLPIEPFTCFRGFFISFIVPVVIDQLIASSIILIFVEVAGLLIDIVAAVFATFPTVMELRSVTNICSSLILTKDQVERLDDILLVQEGRLQHHHLSLISWEAWAPQEMPPLNLGWQGYWVSLQPAM